VKIVACRICDIEYGISWFAPDSNYVCPDCDYKIKNNIPITLGKKKDDKFNKLQCVCYGWPRKK